MFCWIDRVCRFKECACCACDHSVNLSTSFHRFCLCFCMSEVISSFESWITGVCSPYVVSLCDFACYVVG